MPKPVRCGRLILLTTGFLGLLGLRLEAEDVTTTATVSAVSQYMFRGLRLGDGGVQPSLEATVGNLTLGAWGHFPVDGGKVSGSSDPEMDLYGAYNLVLDSGAILTPGFTWYNYPNAPDRDGFYRATFEPNLALSHTAHGVRVTTRAYYDVMRKGATFEATATYAWPLKTIGSELDFTLSYGGYKWKDSARGVAPELKAWGQYWLAGVSMPFQVALTARVALGVAFSEGWKAYTKAGTAPRALNPRAVGHGVVTLSYTRSF